MNANIPARDERADRNLLFGVLALQMDFIRREDLIAATSAWVLDKARGLDQILLQCKALTADEHGLLVALVAKHLAKHNDDPQQSLAAVSSVGSIRDELRKLGDPQLDASLAAVAQQSRTRDPFATNVPSTCDWGGPGLRFRVLRPHARGGLGEVFVAQDLELHREVALKEIQSRFADQPDSRSRFVLEAEITGGLEHPGIVPVYGLGQYADGRPFYAMRFIRGDSLAEAIARFHKADVAGRDPGERTLELRKLLGRFIDVCEAMEYAHSRGILHRDLKPGNIMLGKYGETLVVDWGLAKSVGRGERASETGEPTLHPSSGDSVDPTIMGKAIGTPAYMSPEQAAGRLNELGPASDVYSLGATLYSLLTGQPPFSGSEKGEILQRVEQGDFPPPRELKPKVPAGLQAICLKAMAMKTTDRYPSPKMLADDIEHWLADEPVACCPEPPRMRARRWLKRHPTLVVGTAATVLISLVSLAAIASVVSQSNRTLAAMNLKLDAKNREVDQANTRLVQVNKNLEQANASERAAKQDADQKRSEAEKARDETKQVLNYLVASFRKPNPSADGEKLTVAELLDRAAERLDTTFPDKPFIQARLLNVIGLIAYDLGLYEKAIPLLDRARELRRNEIGEDRAYALTLMNLAVGYESAGCVAEALTLCEQILEFSTEKLGLDDELTLAAMTNLARVCTLAGRLTEALPLYEQTLELKTAKFGPEHQDTLASMGNLAEAYLLGKQPEKALPLFDRFIAGYCGRATPNDPAFAGLLATVSIDLLKHHEYAAAETYLRECLTIREKTLPDDWRLFNTRSLMGGALAGQKKFKEAEPLLVEGYQAMKDRESKIPPAAKTRLNETIQRLVDLYTAWEKPEEAAKWKAAMEEAAKPSSK